MCCCGKPIVNGEFGYKWQPNDAPGVRESDPPELRDGDELIYDEPGRCGGLDSHSHHYRVVARTGYFELLVRHGGGEDRVSLAPRRCSLTLLQPLIQRSGTGYSIPSTTPTETANAGERKNRTRAGGRLLLRSASRSVRFADRRP